jgi:hypothetical protein
LPGLTQTHSLRSNCGSGRNSRTAVALAIGRLTDWSGAMVEKRGDTIIETAQEARQAERGPTVRNVLVWSTGLIVVAFAIVWYIFFRT